MTEKTEKLKLPMTRAEYLAKYIADPDALALITLLEETDEKLKKVEADAGKMAMVLSCFSDSGNWKQNKIYGVNESHSVFLLGQGKVGGKLVEWLAKSMHLV